MQPGHNHCPFRALFEPPPRAARRGNANTLDASDTLDGAPSKTSELARFLLLPPLTPASTPLRSSAQCPLRSLLLV
jgi:hypothetical protein